MADDFTNCARCEEITHRGYSQICEFCDKIFCKSCAVCQRNDFGCEKSISPSQKRYDKLYDRLIRYATEIYRLREKYKDTDNFFFDGNTSSDSDSDSDNDESNHQ